MLTRVNQNSAVPSRQPGLIRLGLIGCGAVVTTHHWPNLRRLAHEITVIALARRDRVQAHAFARQADVPRVYTDYRELLADKDVDAVLTAVPIELNGIVLLDALRAGKHVLAEKPLAATPAEARRALAEAERRRRVVLIGENFRYRRDVAKCRDLIQAGAVGSVFAFQMSVKFDVEAPARRPWISRGWRKTAKHRGGFILDAGVHPISAIRVLLGEVSEVSAHLRDTSSAIKGPDSLMMQMVMRSGVIGQCFFCYTAKETRENAFDLSVFGTAGVLRLTPGKIALTRGATLSSHTVRVPETGGEYLRQWRNFCAAIRGREPVISTPLEAYRDLLVIDAALRSSCMEKQVRVHESPK